MRRLLTTACIAVAAGGWSAPASPAATGPRWSVATAPFSISFVSGSTLLTREVVPPEFGPGPGHRLSYETADGATHTLTSVRSSKPVPGGIEYTVSTDEPGRTATVALTHHGQAVQVQWTLEPSDGVTAVWEALESFPGEHFLGGGENEHAVDLSGQIVPFEVWAPCQSYAPVPFYASTHGYGLAVATPNVGSAEFAGSERETSCAAAPRPQCPLVPAPQEVQLCVRASGLAYDVYAGTPASVLSAYVVATGRPMLPPPEEFGLVQWRDSVTGPAQLIGDATTLRRLQIPIESVQLDNPWELGLCYGSLQFGPPHFPGDPKKMIDALHRLGIKLLLWISPYVRTLPGCPAPAYPVEALLGAGDSHALDLTQSAVYTTFVSKLEALHALGVDGVKGDRGDEIDLEPLQLAGGPGVELQNLYPTLFDKAIETAFGEGRPRTWLGYVRAAGPLSRALVPGIWSGDQPGSFEGLQEAIRAAATAGVSGFPIWGSDIGGFGSAQLTAEVFARWAQLGSISPIFEVGGAGPNATFWDFGAAAVDGFRASAVLHYELYPYLYELARGASGSGTPVLRPLGYDFPGDERAWRADLELMLGPSLLALPVTVPVGEHSAQYFPPGRWVSLWGGPDVVGPLARNVGVPLGMLPLYLRAGSAIPFDFRQPLVWQEPWAVDELDQPGRIGWVYAPAPGKTHARSADERFSASDTTGRIGVTFTGGRRQIQLLVLTTRRPSLVAVDGRPVEEATGPAGLRSHTSGWTLERGRFRGMIVKVTATGTRTHVAISF